MQHRTAVSTVVSALCGALALALPAQAASARQAGHIIVFGHRGASAYAPENTLDSVQRAADLGVDWVENDVQRTRDGALVVIHDTTLARTTNVEQRYPDRAPWSVGSFSLAEIKQLDAGSWFGPDFRGERIPTLQEYLDLLDDTGQGLLLELKQPELYPGIERQTLDVLDRADWLDRPHLARRLIVQSFSAPALRTTHRLRPEVRTGFLGNPPVSQLKQYAAFTDEINAEQHSVTAAYVKAVHGMKGAHSKAMRINTWTVDNAPAATKLVRMGVDGIITDRPDLIESATRRRT
ncbi:glycerophosphodiester phosphodiesterase [Streptomyces sp. WM6378]|uniref:glycerophosphodiester phosphodiesterase n=1 Tax=Streptomyces sp. WM6378 TaxID=1415557 RepID=UPI0006AEC36C|nr:glycerophosphodiester phosphodiesterase family protein [Streptomyces sp. WM6378]KOU38432.1 glycerophosphodiester phosphodiesterase [Streptomyces sp. WM6378]